MHVNVGTIEFHDVERIENFVFADSLLMETHIWTLQLVEALRSHIDKRPGYRCMIGRSPNECFFSHVIGLLFWFM